MGTAAWLATVLDQELLETVRGITIAPRHTEDRLLHVRPGAEVARELGGRYLLRYMLPEQVARYTAGSTMPHHVTPTPYAPQDTVTYLALPRPTAERSFVMLIDPARIPEVQGPRWVRLGIGIEYILPKGFPKEAIVVGWEVSIT